jgi:predicted permease
MELPLGIRQALRRLASSGVLSVVSVLILSFGIGAAVVMVDVLDRILLRAPVHVREPDRVARVYLGLKGGSYLDRTRHSTLEALATMHDDVEASAAYLSEPLSVGRGQDSRRIESVACSVDYFTVLGVQPLLGSFAEACAREDAAVISHAMWRQEFGGAPDVLGRPLRLGLDTYSIVAVAPKAFAGIGYKAADAWLPLEPRAKAGYGAEWKTAHPFLLQVIARLRPGVNRERANERATAAYAARKQAWETSTPAVVLGDLRPARAPGAQLGTRVEVLLAGMSLVVLLITCGNVANLLLVRGLRRERELVVKTALGASRGRLVREVLAEALFLSAAAGTLALGVVTIGSRLVRGLLLSPIAALASPIDARMVLLTALFCVVAAFVLGLAPAFRLTRPRMLRPGHAAPVRPSRMLDVFSGAQVALSVPVIIAAALFVSSLWNASHQDFGMRTDRVAVVTTNLFEVGRPWENHDVHRRMQARVARLPQVESTALVQNMPMQGATMSPIFVPGRETPDGPVTVGDTDPVSNPVDPSFFTVMGMRLMQGRFFTDDENRKGARPVAVITESMARNLWPGETVIGKCFFLFSRDGPCQEVVGVIADARLYPSIRPTNQWASAFYLPIEQASGVASDRALLVRTTHDPSGILQVLRREAQVAAPDLPFVDAHGFDDLFTAMLRPWRLGSVVFALFGALSITIAAVGLVVIGAYAVTRRTREIGIRSALGAGPPHIIWLVLRRSLVVILAGLMTGIGLAWTAGRVLDAQLFNISASDARVFVTTALGVFGVGTIAAWLSARRAARIDPVVALRTE